MNFSLNHKTLVRGVELALLLVLAFLLVSVFRVASTIGGASIPAKLSTHSSLTTTGQKTLVNSEILKSFDFFHREDAVIAAVEVKFVPETNLNLKVFGMRADLKGPSSSAIIQTPDMKQSTYYVGDEIIPSVQLTHVDIDYVLLNRNGVSERLSRQGRTKEDLDLKTIAQNKALSFKAAKMIQDLRFYPHREGKKVVGFRVLPRRGSKLETYGFKRNDIVTSINGQDMTQERINLKSLWDNVKLARYASIQVIRDGTLKTIEVNLQ